MVRTNPSPDWTTAERMAVAAELADCLDALAVRDHTLSNFQVGDLARHIRFVLLMPASFLEQNRETILKGIEFEDEEPEEVAPPPPLVTRSIQLITHAMPIRVALELITSTGAQTKHEVVRGVIGTWVVEIGAVDEATLDAAIEVLKEHKCTVTVLP